MRAKLEKTATAMKAAARIATAIAALALTANAGAVQSQSEAGMNSERRIEQALGSATRAWSNRNPALAKALIKDLVACGDAGALALWGEIHEHEGAQRTAHDAYTEAALRGNASAHLALARSAALSELEGGTIRAYAHMIVYGWLSGGSAELRTAMRQHAEKMNRNEEMAAYENAEHWRDAMARPLAHRHCRHAQQSG